MISLGNLIALVRARVPLMHALVERLVCVNSYSRNVAGVNACGALLVEAFRIPGLSLRVERGGAGAGDHLFWSTPAAREGQTVLIIGHHDTVFPPGEFEGYQVSSPGEQLRGSGPGCFDMKGGLAVIWGVLDALAEAQCLDEVPLVLASVADEEVGSRDSRPHLEACARLAACGLVFESGRAGDAIVTRRRGVGIVRAKASGRAAHAGNAHAAGANAIWTLARFIESAQRLTDYDRGVTVNVGTVQGGTSTNTVPAQAEASVDLRFDTVGDGEGLVASLREAAVRAAVPGTRLELEGGVNRPPMEKSAASEALYREYAACQREAGLGAAEHPLVGGGSDGNTASAVGLPVIDGLGPRGGGFHTKDEHVELASFAPKAEALLRFLHGRFSSAGAR